LRLCPRQSSMVVHRLFSDHLLYFVGSSLPSLFFFCTHPLFLLSAIFKLLHQDPEEEDQVGVMHEKCERNRHREYVIVDEFRRGLDAVFLMRPN